MIEPHFPRKRRIVVFIIEQIAVKDLNCKKGRREYLGATCVFLALFLGGAGGGEGGKGSRGKFNLVKIN